HPGGMAGGTDTGSGRVLLEQPPAHARLAVDVGPFVEVAEALPRGRASMPAGRPLTVDGGVAVGAGHLAFRVGGGIDPFIVWIVVGGQGSEGQAEGAGAGARAGNEEALTKGSEALAGPGAQAEPAGGVAAGGASGALAADHSTGDGEAIGQDHAFGW